MTEYTANTDFWRKGQLVPKGTSVSMTKAEAKYLGHALTEKGAEVAAPVASATVADAAPAPIAYAAVEEVAQGKKHRKAE
jgi:hypothetical protein